MGTGKSSKQKEKLQRLFCLSVLLRHKVQPVRKKRKRKQEAAEKKYLVNNFNFYIIDCK